MQVPDQIAKIVGDDRAVSPVIGVILMVAITVILAAVIGGFVLNIGGSQEVTPQASIDFDFDDTGNQLTIVHDGGDPIEAAQLSLSVQGSGSLSNTDFTNLSDSLTTFEAGDSVTLSSGDVSSEISAGDRIQVVYTSESQQGSVLSTFTVPEGANISD